ncbi:MAG: ATP-dependent DNA helicase RecG [Acidobacteria bacterium]|nr:MAG: ATP-dependent DNA helicase RecG [Acidobacteriota bacterium]
MPTSRLTLSSEVKYLKGVGPARAELLASRAIRTVEDLLYYTPFRYEDRTRLTRIRDLVPGQTTTVLGKVLTCGLTRTRRGKYVYDLAAAEASGRMGAVGAGLGAAGPSGSSQGAKERAASAVPGSGVAPAFALSDPQPGTKPAYAGGMIRCKWFNAVYLEKNKVFRPGQLVFFYGRVDYDPYGRGNFEIIQPEFEIVVPESESESGSEAEPEPQAATEASLQIGRIVPVYESVGTLGSRVLRKLVWGALASLDGQVPECLPESVRRKNNLMDRSSALSQTHFPDRNQPLEDLARFRTPAQVRLIFEELFNVGAGLALKRRKAKSVEAAQFRVTENVRQAIKKILPFHPTTAQKRVLKEIVEDMCSAQPMNRLLQGDVGSGKTIVAIQAAIVAIESGWQVALMAPTEILAMQHYLYMKQLLRPLPYQVDVLISARKAGEKEELKKRIAQGAVHLVVGTHALIEPDVEFPQLGLVVVDEQHRFGVLQRYKLIRKGPAPHVLVMTATPIPRTLALTLYGDLDVSVVDQLPPNRTPIETRLLTEPDRARTFELIRAKVKTGEQAYVVYPLIEESAKLDLRPAVRMYEHLSRNVFPEFRLGLLHGRLPSEEKERVMRAFKEGEIQILVSTTVVEVGVDVPNATVMLIEHAERFGLAPLHQLRGRIGRGRRKSTCLLLAGEPRTEIADQRLRTMTESTDGFRIAEIDLKLRGPGEFLGTRQAGIPTFRIANLLRDEKILEWAKREAAEFVEHPASSEELEAFVQLLRKTWPQRYGLARVG